MTRWIPWLLLVGCAQRVHTTRVGDAQVLTLRHAYANAHVVSTSSGPVLVDPGAESDAERVDEQLRARGIEPASLVAVLVTHGHADHAGGAGWFQRRYGVPVVVGAGDAERFASGHNDALCPTDRRAERRLEDAQALGFTPFEPDVVLDGSASLPEAPEVRAVPLAGHTEGSVVYVVGEAVFVGDPIRGAVAAPGARRHYYMCDLADNDADVHTVLEDVAPEASMWFTGHFGPVRRRAVTRRWPGQGDPAR